MSLPRGISRASPALGGPASRLRLPGKPHQASHTSRQEWCDSIFPNCSKRECFTESRQPQWNGFSPNDNSPGNLKSLHYDWPFLFRKLLAINRLVIPVCVAFTRKPHNQISPGPMTMNINQTSEAMRQPTHEQQESRLRVLSELEAFPPREAIRTIGAENSKSSRTRKTHAGPESP